MGDNGKIIRSIVRRAEADVTETKFFVTQEATIAAMRYAVVYKS